MSQQPLPLPPTPHPPLVESPSPPNSKVNTTPQHNSESPAGEGVHHRRTLYMVRHGEAIHNLLEEEAQERVRREAAAEWMNLSPEETLVRMEEARKAVLLDPSLRDAGLTDKGRQQARDCGKRLQEFIDQTTAHPAAPTEAIVSPLVRTLETCHIILNAVSPEMKAHIRPEIQERRTRLPPDTPRRKSSLLQFSFIDDRFIMEHFGNVSPQDVEDECIAMESNEMLRERAGQLFDLLMEMDHRHILIVSHKGYLREVERGLLGLDNSPLFKNAELRVYRVEFTRGNRKLKSLERLL